MEQSFIVIFCIALTSVLGYIHYKADELNFQRIEKLESEVYLIKHERYVCQEEVERLGKIIAQLTEKEENVKKQNKKR